MRVTFSQAPSQPNLKITHLPVSRGDMQYFALIRESKDKVCKDSYRPQLLHDKWNVDNLKGINVLKWQQKLSKVIKERKY